MTGSSGRVLIVDDDASLRDAVARVLRSAGHDTESAGDAESALDAALTFCPDLVLVDLDLPDRTGLELVGDFTARGVDATMVMLTGKGTIDSAVEAMRRGVFDYLSKPVDPDRLVLAVGRGVEHSALRKEVQRLRRAVSREGQFAEMVGRSPAMLELYRQIEQVAPTSASVLILGESGTGKELIAGAVHRQGPRAEAPFIAINCGAIPENLLESELFGHEKGAFTGATAARAGCFEGADGGTLLLDEIGEMPPELQTKLLRVLEDGKVRRLGGSREVTVDVRIIAATNADVEAAIREKRLRQDLYFRLNVFTIRAPALRERPEDIPILAAHFLHRFVERDELTARAFSQAAMDELKRRTWSGNVRELRNAVQHAAILCRNTEIQPEHLPGHPRATRRARTNTEGVVVPVGTAIADAEREIILATLDACDGNKTKTAEVLGISVKTLYTRLNEYGERDRPRSGGADASHSEPAR